MTRWIVFTGSGFWKYYWAHLVMSITKSCQWEMQCHLRAPRLRHLTKVFDLVPCAQRFLQDFSTGMWLYLYDYPLYDRTSARDYLLYDSYQCECGLFKRQLECDYWLYGRPSVWLPSVWMIISMWLLTVWASYMYVWQSEYVQSMYLIYKVLFFLSLKKKKNSYCIILVLK